MLAYSYVRFSSQKQALGDSLRRQIKDTAAWCERNGISLATENFEDLGVSAWTGENWREGGLSIFLQAVKEKKLKTPCMLIIENLDRLSRDQVSRALALFEDILNAGITIQTLSPERTYPPEFAKTGGMAMLDPIISFILANEESTKKSNRLKSLWVEKRRVGGKMGALCPAWLQWNPATQTYEAIEAKADVVRMIFNLSADGHGSHSIVRHLDKLKIKSIKSAKAPFFAPAMSSPFNQEPKLSS